MNKFRSRSFAGCSILQPKSFHSYSRFWAILAHPGRKNNPAVVLFYDFCVHFVKYLRKCNRNIGKNFSIKDDIVFCHTSDKCAVFVPFFFYCSRKSLDSKSSEVSLFLFSAFVSMLSLFYQCQSYLFIYFTSSESKPLCKSNKLFMSSLSLKPVCYSYHLNYWL